MGRQPPKVEIARNDAPEIDLRPIIEALEKQRGSKIEELNDDDEYWMKSLAQEFGITTGTVTIGGYASAIQRSIGGMKGDVYKDYVKQLENLYKKVVPLVGNQPSAA